MDDLRVIVYVKVRYISIVKEPTSAHVAERRSESLMVMVSSGPSLKVVEGMVRVPRPSTTKVCFIELDTIGNVLT